MGINVTAYSATEDILWSAILSEDTYTMYVQEKLYLILEGVLGDSKLQYVTKGTLANFTVDEVKAKSNLKQGFIWKMPERVALDTRTLVQSQQYCWNKIKASRSSAEDSPFTFQGTLYDANVPNISGASQMALIAQGMSQPFSIEWTTRNNSVVTLNGSEMISLGIALGSRNSQVYDTARVLRAEIDAATTNSQVDAITWPS